MASKVSKVICPRRFSKSDSLGFYQKRPKKSSRKFRFWAENTQSMAWHCTCETELVGPKQRTRSRDLTFPERDRCLDETLENIT